MQFINPKQATDTGNNMMSNQQMCFPSFSNLKTELQKQVNLKRNTFFENIFSTEEYATNFINEENIESCEIIVLPPATTDHVWNTLNTVQKSHERYTDNKTYPNYWKTTEFTKKFWPCSVCSSIFLSIENFELHLKNHNFEQVCKALVSLTRPNCISVLPSIKPHASISEALLPVLESDIINLNTTEYSEVASNDCNDFRKSLNYNDMTYIQNVNNLGLPEVKNKKLCSESIIAPRKLKDSKKKNLKSRDPHSCPICRAVLCSRGNLVKHVVIHQKEKPFSCQQCNIGFNAKRDVQQHFNMHHANLPPSICTICDKKFSSPISLKNHKIIHRPAKSSQCTKCHRWYKSIKCLKQHMTRHRNKTKFSCSFCQKLYTLKKNLVIHSFKAHSTSVERIAS